MRRSCRPTSCIFEQVQSIPVDRPCANVGVGEVSDRCPTGHQIRPSTWDLCDPKICLFRGPGSAPSIWQIFTPRGDPEFEHFLGSNSVTPRGVGGAQLCPLSGGVKLRSQPSSVGTGWERVRQVPIRHPGTGWSDPVLGQGLATSAGRRQRRVGDCRSGTPTRVPDRALRHVDLRVPDRHSAECRSDPQLDTEFGVES